MRLLVSCIPFDGGKSGLSVYAREIVRALRAQGHELTFASLFRFSGNREERHLRLLG